jgi:hypothetical protein
VFTDFEFKAKVMIESTAEGSNSGIFFHTDYVETGWPPKGYECQVNATKHKDPRKTGGLYAVQDVLNVSPVADGEWFDYEISVKGKHVMVKINGKVTTDFTEPADWDPSVKLPNAGYGLPGRRFSSGLIALQAHDPLSRVRYKDLKIKPLP